MKDFVDKLGFFKILFEAMPISVCIVDQAGQVLTINQMGKRIFHVTDRTVFRCPCGDVLHCVHAIEPGGCGNTPYCKSCVIRNTALAAIEGMSISRKKGACSIIVDGQVQQLTVLVTSTPLWFENTQLAVVIVEDVSNVTELEGLLPICCSCHRIRNDQGYWTRLEEYIKKHSEAEFTHDICPECAGEMKLRIS